MPLALYVVKNGSFQASAKARKAVGVPSSSAPRPTSATGRFACASLARSASAAGAESAVIARCTGPLGSSAVAASRL